MSDRDALLAAILANPAEDTPRLVYADWLQENGEPARGEFVRLVLEEGGADYIDVARRRGYGTGAATGDAHGRAHDARRALAPERLHESRVLAADPVRRAGEVQRHHAHAVRLQARAQLRDALQAPTFQPMVRPGR